MGEGNYIAKSGGTDLTNTLDSQYRHFGEQTDGNNVTILIDGQEMFAALQQDLASAQTSIWIAGLELLAEIELTRGQTDGSNPKTLLEQLSDIATNKPSIQIRVLLFAPSILQGLAGATKPDQAKKALEDKLHNVVQVRLDRTLTGTPLAHVPIIGPTYSGISGAAHQKVVVIDGKVGYCGGLDLTFGRWDTPAHDYQDDRRDSAEVAKFSDVPAYYREKWRNEGVKKLPAVPWHDIHARLIGPAVWDLQLNFLQRWFYADGKDSAVIKEWEREQNKPGKYRSVHGSDGKCRVRVARTWKQAKGAQCNCKRCTYKGREIDAFSIEQVYKELFREAQHFLYLENQYAFQNTGITNALIAEIRGKPDLKTIIVLPVKPDLITKGKEWGVFLTKLIPIPIIFPSLWTFEGVPDLATMNKNLKRIRDESGGRAKVFCLVAHHGVAFSTAGTGAPLQNIRIKGLPIYVHAKVAICDDRLMTLGSANLDDWGLGVSSELNVLIDDKPLVQSTRIRLWREHLGDWEYESQKFKGTDWWSWWGRQRSSNFSLDKLDLCNSQDTQFALELWDRLSMHNVCTVRDKLQSPELSTEEWVGHLYPYAYAEMKLPEPFEGAEAGGIAGSSPTARDVPILQVGVPGSR